MNESGMLFVREENELLKRKLLNIWRTALSFQEEQGINALYLALGRLDWYESDSSQTSFSSPLIFVPLQVARLQGDEFRFTYEGAEVMHNLVLAEKLKQDFRVEIPPLVLGEEAASDDVYAYLQSVSSAIAHMNRWRLEESFATVSFFNFTKFVIYKDIDPNLWLDEHNQQLSPVISLLLSEHEMDIHDWTVVNEDNLDSVRPVALSLEVFNADSSQIAALLQAKHSKVMVIEGPPGTGKSQTITNLIAESIYEGKRVLFVSEKKAALDVVWQRLKEAGLSQACMELHSSKANKKSFYEQINETLRTDEKHSADLKHELDTLSRLRETVNAYYSVLHSPLPDRNVSPYTCIVELCRLGSARADKRVSFTSMRGWTHADFSSRRDTVKRVQSFIKRYGLPVRHPLWGMGTEKITLTDFEAVKKTVQLVLSLLQDANKAFSETSLHELNLLRSILRNVSAEEIDKLTEDLQIIKRHYSTLFRFLLPKYRSAYRRAQHIVGNTWSGQDFPKLVSVSEIIWKIEQSLSELLNLLEARGTLVQWTQLSYIDLGQRLERLLDISYDDFQSMARYNQLRRAALNEQLEEWICWAETDERFFESMLTAYERTWYEGVLQEAFAKFPVLLDFSEGSDEIVEQFRLHDQRLLRINRLRIAIKHWEQTPRYRAAGNLKILQRELQKARNHKPIRRIMQEAGEAIFAIKPVFMMSPLSVATYLPYGKPIFDLVIFDEASQIKPEDAFSAILRAKQVVIVGDTKQLPPTHFFDRLASEDENDEDDVAIGLDSILDLACASIPEGSPHRRMLRWHYRSKHPSLISCSNRRFYNDRLIVPPSTETRPKQMGMVFHHLPNTVYDRGRTRTNRQEAQRIAEAVFSHLKLNPGLSLGVVALSVQQQEAIWDAIEQALRENSDDRLLMEAHDSRHMHERFFVKNLETVQGDERDTIFVSIGYGRDERGTLSMNFGPLNKEGGEKRLNVLFTRARQRCEIFCNFRWSDMRMDTSSPKGVSALYTFLHYAETGSIDQPHTTHLEPMSPFEESVIRVLEEAGYTVVPQVGTAGFYIDIGVLNPREPGKFLLGVECDGARYHSSKTARDRDRLRQEILEQHGWRIHRIWSTSWYKNFANERERLLNAVRLAIAEEDTISSQRTKENLLGTELETQFSPKPDKLTEKTEARSPNDTQCTTFENYQIADLSRFVQPQSIFSNIHSANPEQIAEIVEHIAIVESPIHIEEVFRRIREAANFARAGKNIRRLIVDGVQWAQARGKVDFDGQFVTKPTDSGVVPRTRRGFPQQSKRIEYIHPLEIRQAIIEVVRRSFGICVEEVCSEVLRCFGFERATEPMRAQVEKQLKELLAQGALKLEGRTLSFA